MVHGRVSCRWEFCLCIAGVGSGETLLWVSVIPKVNFLEFCELVAYFAQCSGGTVRPTGDNQTVLFREVYFFEGCRLGCGFHGWFCSCFSMFGLGNPGWLRLMWTFGQCEWRDVIFISFYNCWWTSFYPLSTYGPTPSWQRCLATSHGRELKVVGRHYINKRKHWHCSQVRLGRYHKA